jgi:AraC-like DNA-binding protein
MKPSFEEISSRRGEQAFLAYEYTTTSFPFNWHYHPEYELTYILAGTGERLVGDNNESFGAGDLVLMGSDLPHTWSSSKKSRGKSAAIVIQFAQDFLDAFLRYSEFKRVDKLLVQSKQGVHFNIKTNKVIIDKIKSLPHLIGVERVSGLLEILNLLANVKTRVLSSAYYHKVKGKENENRINTVCSYIKKHFTTALPIQSAADTIGLSLTAFCKFFKRAVGKTFSDYVNDIRIGYACELLSESDKPIATICYESGFENISYFNRVFLEKKKMRPNEYRKLMN